MNMKTRLTVTIDPDILDRAKKLAYARKTNVSALVEDLLRTAPATAKDEDFATRWAGKYTLAPSNEDDVRMRALKAKYKLPDSSPVK